MQIRLEQMKERAVPALNRTDQMAQTLIVYQSGNEWVARDVTGSNYGQSSNLFETIEAAERLAKRLGATVRLSREAQNYLLTQGAKKSPLS